MEYCNVGDMAEYMANYMADRVRVSLNLFIHSDLKCGQVC